MTMKHRLHLYIICCILMILLTFVNWKRFFEVASGIGHDKSRYEQILDHGNHTDPAKLAVREYKKVEKEIQMRLEHEHVLFQYKYIVIGAIFAFLLGTGLGGKTRILPNLYDNGYLALIFGIASLGLLVIDVRINYNFHIISELGEWTRLAYEQKNIFGWETYLHNYAPFHSTAWFSLAMASLWWPTIFVLLGYYLLMFKFSQSFYCNLLYIQTFIFLAVQLGVLLFFMSYYMSYRNSLCKPEIWIWFAVFLDLLFIVTECGIRKRGQQGGAWMFKVICQRKCP
jgi:hypothetical protein